LVINNCLIIIVSSPSGVGKTTITNKLLKKIKKSYLSVSCTTRNPRKNERHKVDYFFISKEKFFQFKKQKKFLETAKVHNNYYGTLKTELKKNSKHSKVVLLDIDWQGARSIKKKIKNNCYSFFLLPPSIAILKRRLLRRHHDNKKLALSRLSSARKDLRFWEEYDYVYVNDKLIKCVNEIYKKISQLLIEKNQRSYFKKIVKKL
tara:strand:+ start:1070 stop:1684 length:615 start_codon:yes stop_codon:yes gene_type:complete